MTSIQWDANLLRSLRQKSQTEVDRTERKHDVERGQWIANQIVHHEPQESRH